MVACGHGCDRTVEFADITVRVVSEVVDGTRAILIPTFTHIPTVPVVGMNKDGRKSAPLGHLTWQLPLIELP